MDHDLKEVYRTCLKNLEAGRFEGYDPYDLLNSPKRWLGRLPPRALFLISQVNKRSPLNFRPLLGIRPSLIPKGKALLLRAVLNCPDLHDDMERTARDLLASIQRDALPGYHGACWGLPFRYANRVALRENAVGDVVATSFVHEGLCAFYQHFPDDALREVLISTSRFVLQDLKMREHQAGLSLNYDTQNTSSVLNSIGLAADILVRNYQLTADESELQIAERLLDFVVSFQDREGVFPYAVGSEKKSYQTDFHQLYVLSSLLRYQRATGEKKYQASLQSGLQFFLDHQVRSDGSIKWRYPRVYPIDIHNQASAILYLSSFSPDLPVEPEVVERIVAYTVRSFYRRDKGYFIYQKYPFLSNAMNYIRWGQCWMLLAISEYLKSRRILTHAV